MTSFFHSPTPPSGLCARPPAGNFTALSVPANLPHRFSSPLNQELKKFVLTLGPTELASDVVRVTLDDLPMPRRLAGAPLDTWDELQQQAEQSSVAAVDACRLPFCYFFESQRTPGCSNSDCGSLHLHFKPDPKAFANNIDLSGSPSKLLLMAIYELTLTFRA